MKIIITFIILFSSLVFTSYNYAESTVSCSGSCLDTFNELKKYARNGSPHAQILLALTYKAGVTDNRADDEKAWKWMKRARSQSFPPALYHISKWYREGYNTSPDAKKADSLLKRSALFGYAPAMYELGIRKLNKQQPSDGMRYIRAAAEMADARATSFVERITQLGLNTTDISLDDSALVAALPETSLIFKGSSGRASSPESLFAEAVDSIKKQAVYNQRNATGSHIGRTKCGQSGSGCRVIPANDTAIYSDIWLRSHSTSP